MESVLSFFQEVEFAGLTLGRLVVAFLLILAGFTARRLLSGVVINRLAALARRTRTSVDDLMLEALRAPLAAGVVMAGIGAATIVLQLPTEPVDVRGFVSGALLVAIALVAVWLLFRLIDALAAYYGELSAKTDSTFDDMLVPLFRKALKVFVGVIAFVVVVQNMGYSVSGILAGLGIGGLAVALAAKDTLANVFGSVTILIDKPFRVGDWIKTSEFEGIVEEIGFRSTRIRTWPRTLVVVPNNALVNMTVDNHQAMPVRRIFMTIGVTYDTTAPQMRTLLGKIEEHIQAIDGISPDGWVVRFTDFGGSSLDIKIRCFTIPLGWDDHMAIRQELLLRIMTTLEELDLEIAFPSQSLYFGRDQQLNLAHSEEEAAAAAAWAAGTGSEAPGAAERPAGGDRHPPDAPPS